MVKADRHRLLALDGLRGAACTAIVLLHVWMFDHGVRGGGGEKNLLDLVIGELRRRVLLFFALSWFLLDRPFVAAAPDASPAPSPRTYAVPRAPPTLPGYW